MKKKTRILARRKADSNHEVITITSPKGTHRYCRRPCEECPWRKDSPVGAFPAEAYRISAKTAYDMADSTFACHMAGKENPADCAGFMIKGSYHNLSVRMGLLSRRIIMEKITSDVELYDSYREMAEANGVDPNDPILQPCR